jgi:hypothetical protein
MQNGTFRQSALQVPRPLSVSDSLSLSLSLSLSVCVCVCKTLSHTHTLSLYHTLRVEWQRVSVALSSDLSVITRSHRKRNEMESGRVGWGEASGHRLNGVLERILVWKGRDRGGGQERE